MDWERWDAHHQKLGLNVGKVCRDGIIDEEQWRVACPKILFIMKEVNDWEGGNLSDLLKSGPRYQMWHTVARWAAGIQNGFPPYSTIDNQNSMKEALCKIATINLKKVSGGAFADWTIINAYAKIDKELLLAQIKEIGPTIIIAGGTFDSLIWLLDLPVNPETSPSLKKPCLTPLITNCLVVPWRHPSRVNNEKTYKELEERMGGLGQ